MKKVRLITYKVGQDLNLEGLDKRVLYPEKGLLFVVLRSVFLHEVCHVLLC